MAEEPQIVTPYLCCKDAARALEFYAKAFGARELVRYTGTARRDRARRRSRSRAARIYDLRRVAGGRRVQPAEVRRYAVLDPPPRRERRRARRASAVAAGGDAWSAPPEGRAVRTARGRGSAIRSATAGSSRHRSRGGVARGAAPPDGRQLPHRVTDRPAAILNLTGIADRIGSTHGPARPGVGTIRPRPHRCAELSDHRNAAASDHGGDGPVCRLLVVAAFRVSSDCKRCSGAASSPG